MKTQKMKMPCAALALTILAMTLIIGIAKADTITMQVIHGPRARTAV